MGLCSAQELWTKREKPVALDLDAVLADGGNGAAQANGAASAHSNGAAEEELGLTDQHRVWSVRESAQVTARQRWPPHHLLLGRNLPDHHGPMQQALAR